MTYTVWVDNSTEGWKPSEEMGTLKECFHYIQQYAGYSPYRITREVEVDFIEKNSETQEPL